VKNPTPQRVKSPIPPIRETTTPPPCGTLLLATRKLFAKTPLTLPQIAERSGLPFYWVRNFSAEDTHDPGVNRVQQLYDTLSGKKLPL
jgi:hypothetical protein